MSGLNENGFDRKSRQQIEDDMMAKAKNYFGNNVNLADNSPLGIILKLISYSLSLIWFVIEAVYNSAFVDTAEGESLDYVGKYVGISRRDATKAVGTVIIKGTTGTVVPKGYKFETNITPVTTYETIEEIEINSFGQVEADIRAVEPGLAGNVQSNTITEILNPISGVDSVYNPDRVDGGLDEESDYDFRQRYHNSVSIGGTSTIESMRAALLDVAGVIGAEVTHNPNMTTVDGMPPKSVQCFVFGGTEGDIVETIFNSKAAGIESYGDISATIIDSMENSHTIKYTRPTEVNIWADISLSTDDDFPNDGFEQVQREVLKYIGGIDTSGTEHLGLSLGEDVIYTKIISVIHNIDGITDVVLNVGTVENPTSQTNVAITAQEVAITAPEQIGVV